MRRPELEYLLTFSSFYKAMYARDKLMERGIPSKQQRVPTQLLRTCGQALLVTGCDLQNIIAVLSENQIDTRGIFQAVISNGKKEYQHI